MTFDDDVAWYGWLMDIIDVFDEMIAATAQFQDVVNVDDKIRMGVENTLGVCPYIYIHTFSRLCSDTLVMPH